MEEENDKKLRENRGDSTLFFFFVKHGKIQTVLFGLDVDCF
jgi:hypothetical protein